MRYVSFLLFLTFSISSSFSQWSTDPTQNLKVASGAINPQICTDGSGGCYIAWETGAPPNRRLLRIQRLDRFGFIQFPEQGLPIRIGEFDQANLMLFEDGVGGAIVVFNELVQVADTLRAVVFAQRFDSTSGRVWGDSAVVVSPSPAHQIPLAVCGDEKGGAFIFWTENRKPDNFKELYVNKIDGDGSRVLGSEGVLIVESEIDIKAEVVCHRSNEFIVSYNQNLDVIVQKFTGKIVPLWGPGVNLGQFSFFRRMATDGNGGVILSAKTQSYFDNQPFFKLWAQRIDSSGNIVWNEGVVLADSVKDPTSPPLTVANSDQNFYFIWRESPMDQGDVFIHLINSKGMALWDHKFPVSLVESKKASTESAIISGDAVILVWYDRRQNIESSSDLYTQLIDKTQNRLWGDSDTAVSVRSGLQFDPFAVVDGNGGIILCWYEIGVGTGNGVFAQQVSRNGNLGEIITSVKIAEEDSNIPSNLHLFQSYPNPFNPSMTIKYHIPEPAQVALKVFNITGKEVITLLDKNQKPGIYQINWNGKNWKGGEVASGIYFYQINVAGKFVQTRKAIFIK
ncbi:MAG: T9SS type A sorting domain-containing protein [bacterium]